MADNVVTQSGTLATVPASTTFAFDEVTINATPVLVGRNKLGYGADGAYTEVDGTNRYPVAIDPADSALLAALLTEATFSARIPAVGQKARAASIPVTLSSEDVALLDALTTPADTQPVSVASLPLPSGAATAANQATANASLAAIEAAVEGTLDVAGAVSVSNFPATQPVSGTVAVSNFPATQPVSGTVTANAGTGTFAVSAASLPLPTGAATEATLADVRTAVQALDNAVAGNELQVDIVAALPAGANNIGDVDVASLPRAATATVTSVADTASSTTLLAANASRLGASVYNDSTVALYLKCGTTASTSDFTVKIPADGYWEAPAGYTGRIDGVWASDASGSARVTEYV